MLRVFVCLLSVFGFAVCVLAEDPSTVIATLNDPAAECRYLRQKWIEAKTAGESYIALTKEFTGAVSALQNAGIFERAAALQRADKLESKTTAYRIISSRALLEYSAAMQVVRAKRGTQESCPGVEKDDYQEPTQQAEVEPSVSLETHLQELKTLREKGLITSEEYYEKRAELLKGF